MGIPGSTASPEPEVRSAALARNPIDSFLCQIGSPGTHVFEGSRSSGFDAAGLSQSHRADSHAERDRRLSTGRTEQCLRTPGGPSARFAAYGERWARIWLDAAGYADSEGVKERTVCVRMPGGIATPSFAPLRRRALRPLRDRTDRGRRVGRLPPLRSPTQEDIDRVASTGFLRMAPDATYSPSNGSSPSA